MEWFHSTVHSNPKWTEQKMDLSGLLCFYEFNCEKMGLVLVAFIALSSILTKSYTLHLKLPFTNRRK